MKHLFRWTTKLLVLMSLVVASLPISAREVVCVIGEDELIVPVAKCGMPCCKERAAPPKQECCLKEQKKDTHVCPLVGKPCRCEVRITAFHGGIRTATQPTSLTFEQPAILPNVHIEIAATETEILEPGIVGIDSGPPRKRPRAPSQPRAPPISL